MFANKLPQIIPAAEFRRVNGQKQMKNYNSIVELTIGPLSNKSEIALVKQKPASNRGNPLFLWPQVAKR